MVLFRIEFLSFVVLLGACTDDTVKSTGPEVQTRPDEEVNEPDDADDPLADVTQDSDGDGYIDLEEENGNTDPDDPDDYPYLGGWPIDLCRDDIESTGNQEGEIAEGFSLLDQHGEMVSLHDFCDHVVFLAAAAFW